MTFYEPGTVAVISADFGDRGFTARGIRLSWGWSTENGEVRDRYVTDVRPLVVLELAGVNLAELAKILDDAANGQIPSPGSYDVRRPVLFDLAQLIREQALPAKPAEPSGLGAVVEDAEGVRWVRVDKPTACWVDGKSFPQRWRDLDVVRVLAEGVPADAGRD